LSACIFLRFLQADLFCITNNLLKYLSFLNFALFHSVGDSSGVHPTPTLCLPLYPITTAVRYPCNCPIPHITKNRLTLASVARFSVVASFVAFVVYIELLFFF